jgi:hypothetical protein
VNPKYLIIIFKKKLLKLTYHIYKGKAINLMSIDAFLQAEITSIFIYIII